jgi:protein SCO1/2
MTRARVKRHGVQGGKAPLYALLLAVGLVVAGSVYHWTDALRQPVPAGQFASLVDHRGRTFAAQAQSRNYKLVVFGYTRCPDVCPASLLKVHEVLAVLAGDASRVVPLFVTVDPATDTPEVLARYASAFDPRILGITGNASELRAFADAYGVVPADAPMPGHADMPGHAAMIYLLGPGNARLALYSPDESARVIAHNIRLRTGNPAQSPGALRAST